MKQEIIDQLLKRELMNLASVAIICKQLGINFTVKFGSSQSAYISIQLGMDHAVYYNSWGSQYLPSTLAKIVDAHKEGKRNAL